MQHAPMNTAISICAAALSALYTQVLSMVVVLYVYHAAFTPITIEDPVGAFGMLLLSWLYGIAVGMIFLSLRPWMPEVTTIGGTIYSRVNMIASGKMFTANTLSFGMLSVFDWNPLFHLIDQARGFTFVNYGPRYTSISYAVYVSLALIMIGLMAEFFTRRHISLSWNARR
jgi:ABC-type polysaccharide/polyol phosphate export permease